MNTSDIGKLVLRVFFSLLMLTHGWGKLNRLFADEVEFGDPLGIGSVPTLILAVFAEFIAPILIIVGFKTRWISLLPIATMTVAVLIVHASDPFKRQELPLLYLTGFVAIALIGPGKYSIDKR
ncbi:MAG: DoxX family protein [Flavobacteriaceae bacterium]|nr:DoxX family protein [Flavobacteriaceae bacterium]